jgi:hypothetical protein
MQLTAQAVGKEARKEQSAKRRKKNPRPDAPGPGRQPRRLSPHVRAGPGIPISGNTGQKEGAPG